MIVLQIMIAQRPGPSVDGKPTLLENVQIGEVLRLMPTCREVNLREQILQALHGKFEALVEAGAKEAGFVEAKIRVAKPNDAPK